MKSAVTKCCLALCLALVLAPARADEREDLESLRSTTLNLIKLLVEQGVLSKEKADGLVKEAEKRAATAKPAAADSKTVRVPYVPEVVRNEIRDQIKQEVLAQAKSERWGDPGALPEWTNRLKWEGDIRFRYQGDRFDAGNASPAFFQVSGQTNVTNTTEDRDRLRVRARLGLLAAVTPGVSAGFRLTTGSLTDPVATNQTLGSYNNKYTFSLDRAYLKLDPWEWLSTSVGRVPNPWFSTDLVWNENLNFDGVAATFRPWWGQQPDFRPYLTLGAFPLQEEESFKDKWIVGGQGGFEWALSTRTRMKVGLGVYDFRNIEGVANTPFSTLSNPSAPRFRQKGNSVFNIDNDFDPGTSLFALAPKFRLANLTGVLDLAHFDPVHVILTGDYVKNIGYDRSEILERTGLDITPRTKGYQARLTVGMPQMRERHDWQVFAGYKYLQRDAVVDAFTDSDFNLGGTNAKGHLLGASYGLARNTWLNFRLFSSREIDGAPFSVDVMQIDLNARF